MPPNDFELLKLYADSGQQDAFAEIVRRHVDLVYAVARRQLGANVLAEDVAQSVFVDLARAARNFDVNTPVIAWLHLVTRRTAIDLARREQRRQAREKIAVELSSMNTSHFDWEKIEPLIDAALEKLGPSDRVALLLRFFENKSLREVGETLGISEDAAQKRVSRALEALRSDFTKRGIALTTAAFATALSVHGAPAAPVALGATITVHIATLPWAALAPVGAAKVAALTVAQKSIVAATAALAFGSAIVGTYFVFQYHDRVRSARRGVESLATEIQDLRAKQASDNAKLSETEKQIDESLGAAMAKDPADVAMAADLRAWLGRVDQLKQLSKERKDLAIPEFSFLPESAWFDLAQSARLDSEQHIRDAFVNLRQKAINRFVNEASLALSRYQAAHDGKQPSSTRELAEYFPHPVEDAVLDRYEMLDPNSPEANQRGIRTAISTKTPLDPERDPYYRFGPGGMIGGSALAEDIRSAQNAFAKANSNQQATNAAQLIPYLRWPLSESVIGNYLQQHSGAGHR